MSASAYSYRLASQHWLRAGRQHDLAACTARAFEHLVQDALVASKVRYVVEPLSGTAPRPASAIGASLPLRRIPAIVSFLDPQPTLSLGVGNRASCPIADIKEQLGGRVIALKGFAGRLRSHGEPVGWP